jgi:hypothetical protein
LALVTTRDIALLLLVERALDKDDQKLLRLMTKRVGVALRLQREKGAAQCEQGPGQYMLSEITRKLFVDELNCWPGHTDG